MPWKSTLTGEVINVSRWLNLDIVNFDGVGKYDIPEISPVTECNASDWLEFSKCLSDRRVAWKKEKTGIHFYQYDGQFERCWSDPTRYGEVLLKYNCVIAPDFSMYTSFPRAVQIWNNYRNHWLAKYWQEDLGMNVIPCIGWSDEESFEWCFDGQPRHSIVAVSNVGCVKNPESHEYFKKGYNEMLKRLDPILVLCWSRNIMDYPGTVQYIKHDPFKRRINEE